MNMVYTNNVAASGMRLRLRDGVRKVTLLSIILVAAYAEGAQPLRLYLGNPTVEDSRISVPVIMDGESQSGVAALDFRITYDPAVVQPAAAEPGQVTLDAGKRVMANTATPGQYVVLIMNFEQSTIAAGEVARLQFEQIAAPADGMVHLAVANQTLSTGEGIALPSEGGAVDVHVGDPVTPPETEPEIRPENDEDGAPQDDAPEEGDNSSEPEPSVAPAPAQETEEPAFSGNVAGPRVTPQIAAGHGQDARTEVQSALNKADTARSTIAAPRVSGPSAASVADEASAGEMPRDREMDSNGGIPPSDTERTANPGAAMSEGSAQPSTIIEDNTPAADSVPAAETNRATATVPRDTKRLITVAAIITLVILVVLRRRLTR